MYSEFLTNSSLSLKIGSFSLDRGIAEFWQKAGVKEDGNRIGYIHLRSESSLIYTSIILFLIVKTWQPVQKDRDYLSHKNRVSYLCLSFIISTVLSGINYMMIECWLGILKGLILLSLWIWSHLLMLRFFFFFRKINNNRRFQSNLYVGLLCVRDRLTLLRPVHPPE